MARRHDEPYHLSWTLPGRSTTQSPGEASAGPIPVAPAGAPGSGSRRRPRFRPRNTEPNRLASSCGRASRRRHREPVPGLPQAPGGGAPLDQPICASGVDCPSAWVAGQGVALVTPQVTGSAVRAWAASRQARTSTGHSPSPPRPGLSAGPHQIEAGGRWPGAMGHRQRSAASASQADLPAWEAPPASRSCAEVTHL